MAFPPEFVEELRNRITLSEVIGRKVALKRKGREYAGLCPFHNEKTPSFWVNDQKAFFHCFGCGAHGDAIGFTMRIEGLSFPDAVEKLAQDVGLAVPVATPQERERAQAAATLHTVASMAARWFEQQLRMPGGRAGLDYLHGRGLSDDTIERFQLGFAPDNREALQATLKRDNVTEQQLVDCGLVIRPDEGGRAPYDRFRGRVMFPIHDRRGRVIAFGGRVIGPGEPKYLNSPETPLFHKGDNLYCLHLAREAAAKDRPIIVAEGYMDVIALHVAGFDGAVAPLGTALTEGQLALLWRMADEPYLCFDGDNAGRRAAQRAAERALPLLTPGKSLRFVGLPPGEDPDSLVRKGGRAAFEAALKAARPLVDIVWEIETLGQRDDTPERRAAIRDALSQRAATIANQVVRTLYRNELDQRFQATWPRFRQTGQPGRFGTGPRRPRPHDRSVRREPSLEELAWFHKGASLATSNHNLDPGRREGLLLGALLFRPALLEGLAEDLAALPLSGAERELLRQALLGAAAEVDHPELGEDVAVLEGAAVTRHLNAAGLSEMAASLRKDATKWFDPEEPEGLARERWRREAESHRLAFGEVSELRAAEASYASDPSEANWERLQALLEQSIRSARTGGNGG
ncbi:MAG: DNA primase [Reyranellaceae bacterium]